MMDHPHDAGRRKALAGLIGAATLLAVPRADAAREPRIAPARLLPPDANGVALPPGFTSRVVARSGESPIAGAAQPWHGAPDGGATFATPDGGWIYVSNSELDRERGGAGALRFDAAGRLIASHPILRGTSVNCAGGATPWGTWLSCEEHERGRVWECDPTGVRQAVVRPALGVFVHEAVAFDIPNGHAYLTEDAPDGLWYRYVPAAGASGPASLEAGSLEAASVDDAGRVRWLPVPDAAARERPTRRQVPGATPFAGGEGIWCAHGQVWFTTKRDDRVWHYDIARQRLRVLYDARREREPVLTGVDNVVLAATGDLLVCEDGGDLQIVAVSPDGVARPVLQVPDHRDSELTGVAFDPSGRRLYFSSQRGGTGRSDDGVTFEVTGPFLTR